MSGEPLKHKAQEIMTRVETDLQALGQSRSAQTLAEVDERANVLVRTLFSAISDVDLQAAQKRVEQLKAENPQATPEELAQMLIREKCRKTGTVGAVTSGAGLIPGLGTVAATTLGVAADIGATFKLQAELVLEIAAVYNYPLTEQEKQQLVMLITGLSAGTATLTRRAGEKAAAKIGEKVAEKTLAKTVLKALPVIGVAASAGTNVLSTYIIGQRADAYFRLGPDAVGSWADSLRAVTGVDERRLVSWLSDGSRSAGRAIAAGAGKAQSAGTAVLSAGQQVGQSARTGVRAYLRWVWGFWRSAFILLRWVFSAFWNALMFLPRRIYGLVRRRPSDE